MINLLFSVNKQKQKHCDQLIFVLHLLRGCVWKFVTRYSTRYRKGKRKKKCLLFLFVYFFLFVCVSVCVVVLSYFSMTIFFWYNCTIVGEVLFMPVLCLRCCCLFVHILKKKLEIVLLCCTIIYLFI